MIFFLRFQRYFFDFMEKYRIPLVKKKAFTRKPKESLEETLAIIKKNAPEIAPYVDITKSSYRDRTPVTLDEHRASFAGTVERPARP